MKKSLIALAVLSTVAGTVAAQSGVTIYGRINPGYAFSEQTDASGKVDKSAGYRENAWTNSRLGINLTEDLGSGNRFIGTWESNIATEGASSVGSVRQAFIGLSNPKNGTLTLGNQYLTEYYAGITVAGTVNGLGFSTTALDASNFNSNTNVHRLGEISSANSLRYVAPKMGDVTLSAQYGSTNTKATGASGGAFTTDTTATVMSLAANYAKGPLNAMLAYSEVNKESLAGTAASYSSAVTVNATSCTASATNICGANDSAGITGYKTIITVTPAASAVDTKQKNWTAAATYDLGKARLFAYYADRQLTGTTNRDYEVYNVGATYTMGKLMPFAQMSKGKLTQGTAQDKPESTQIGVSYAFSKRTNAFAYVAEYKNKLAAGTEVRKSELTAFGLSHNF